MIELDAVDLLILEILQAQGRITNAELAKQTNLSASPCWRRVQRLEQTGVIDGYAAQIARQQIGLNVLVYVSIQLDTHTEDSVSAFEREVSKLSEVLTFHSVAGEQDYILTAACRDLDAYAELTLEKLRRLPNIKAMTSNFVLKEIKSFSGFPLRLS